MTNAQELIKNYYHAFNAKDVQGMLNLVTEEVIHDTNQGSRTVGKKDFLDFLNDMNKFYDENLTNIVIMSNSDQNRASAEFICNGTYLVSAPGLPPARHQKYSLPVGCFFEIKNGKINRITNYYNLNDWLAQVKL